MDSSAPPKPTTHSTLNVDLPATAQQFLTQLLTQRRLSPLTQRRYAQALGVLHTIDTQLSRITDVQMQRAISQQHSAGLSARSLAVMTSSWRTYCAWALRQGMITSNPTVELLTPKISKPLPKAMAVDMIGVFLTKARPAKDVDTSPPAIKQTIKQTIEHTMALRDQAILELLYGCGIRASELIGLDCYKTRDSIGWLDLAVPAIRVLGKGNKPRSVPLPSMALVATQQWLALRDETFKTDTPALFLGVRGARISGTELRRITQRRAVSAQSGQGVNPHMLRHSYASHLLQSTGDLRGVQELLGHASIQATQVYTRLDFQHLAKVYDLAHPRSGVKSHK